MKNISALSISVGPGSDESILLLFNELYDLDSSINLNLFTTSYSLTHPHKKYTVLPIHEAKYHYGTFLVWDLLSLELALAFPNVNKIIFYANDIPWVTNKTISYSKWSEFFDNDKISVLVDNNTLYEIFKLTWKEPIMIEEVTSEKLYEIL